MYVIPDTKIEVEPSSVKSVSLSLVGQSCLKRTYVMTIETTTKPIEFQFSCYSCEYADWLLNEVEFNTIRMSC